MGRWAGRSRAGGTEAERVRAGCSRLGSRVACANLVSTNLFIGLGASRARRSSPLEILAANVQSLHYRQRRTDLKVANEYTARKRAATAGPEGASLTSPVLHWQEWLHRLRSSSAERIRGA
jgi:hypothetical protein